MVGGRVLVGGGTGFVGGAVVRALERRGYEAIIISRSAQPKKNWANISEEESPGGEHDFMARLAKDWEQAAILPSTVETRCVQLRSGVVLGRTGGMIQQTILPFFFGLGGRMGSGQQAMPWIHVKDLAELSVHCLESSTCSGVYNAVAPDIVTNSQFVEAFAGALNRPAIFPAPEFVFNLIFGKERASIVTQSQVVQPARTLESEFEYQFPTIGEACEEFAHLMYVDPDTGVEGQMKDN